MANKKILWGMLVLALAFSLAVIGCSDDTEEAPPPETFPVAKGKLTINQIPATHNGKYIWLSGMVGQQTVLYGLTDITGYPSDIAYKMVKIENGKAMVPLYTINTSATSYSNAFLAYEGNDSITALSILIISDNDGSLTQSEVTSVMTGAVATKVLVSGSFSSGNLTVDW